MKYIRTKDEVFEKTEWQCDLSNQMFLVKANNKFGNKKVFVEDIIKQADTIEELLDTFVICYPNAMPCNIGLRLPKKSRNYFIKETDVKVIYGAIWTDKGLIYVAKMNDKGELELL